MNQKGSDYYLDGLSQGDEIVISQLYNNFFPNVRNFILKNKGTSAEAEEVFQDALFQLSLRLRVSNIEVKSSFEGYLFTVCKNLWRKELNTKKKWVRNEEVIALTHEDQNHSTAILDQERWELFQEKLEVLSQNCKELLKAYFAKVPYDIIVKRFSYSSENVAFQRVFKCKKRLTELIKADTNYRNLI